MSTSTDSSFAGFLAGMEEQRLKKEVDKWNDLRRWLRYQVSFHLEGATESRCKATARLHEDKAKRYTLVLQKMDKLDNR